MSLSDRIRAAMSASGVSQIALARACGVKPPSVHGWMNGKAKFLRGENLLLAARALGVSQDWLATGKGDMTIKSEVNGGGSANTLQSSTEADRLVRLLTVYHLAGVHGKGAIDDVVDLVEASLATIEQERRA